MNAVVYAAGLGDVIRWIYQAGSYKFLSETTSKAAVIVASHNPYTIEIFRHHRNARNFVLFDFGHKFEEFVREGLRGPAVTDALLEFAGLTREALVHGKAEGHVPVFDAPDEVRSEGHVVFCPFAGGGGRNFQPAFTHRVVEVLRKLPVPVYLVTRSFPRNSASGHVIHADEDARRFEGGNIKVMDSLTVPACLNLVRSSSAYVGSWSSLHQAAWFENKPVAVFYPTNWCDVVNRTGYAFGLDRPDCFHSDFAGADLPGLEAWLQQHADQKQAAVTA